MVHHELLEKLQAHNRRFINTCQKKERCPEGACTQLLLHRALHHLPVRDDSASAGLSWEAKGALASLSQGSRPARGTAPTAPTLMHFVDAAALSLHSCRASHTGYRSCQPRPFSKGMAGAVGRELASAAWAGSAEARRACRGSTWYMGRVGALWGMPGECTCRTWVGLTGSSAENS